tara:strand:+ start:1099 stop:2310 length:1212 start_codon:yes stop_codon:yes gene_type:complete
MASYANTGAYLDQLYQEKFGRAPDAAGKAYWQGKLDSGQATASSVAAAFDASEEAQDRSDRGIEVGTADNTSFQKAKASNEAKETITTTGSNDSYDAASDYNNTVNTTVAAFNDNSNNNTPAQSDEEWLKDQYQNILKRDLGDEGKAYWLGDLGKGQTRAQVKANIERSNEKWLGDQYQELFGRDLDEKGREWWMGDLRGDTDTKYGQSERPKQTREQVRANLERHLLTTLPIVPDPDPDPDLDPDPDPDPDPNPVNPDPNPVNPDPDPVNPDPGPVNPDPEKDNDAGTWMGDDPSVGDVYDERYEKLKSDYEDLRRTYDSEFGDKRDFATSRLATGFTIGGFPGSGKDLRSGSTATSDRSRNRSQITAGPKVRDDRPYAPRGIRGGYSTGSTFFDKEGNFRQ